MGTASLLILTTILGRASFKTVSQMAGQTLPTHPRKLLALCSFIAWSFDPGSDFSSSRINIRYKDGGIGW
jgi:hypothetical protein